MCADGINDVNEPIKTMIDDGQFVIEQAILHQMQNEPKPGEYKGNWEQIPPVTTAIYDIWTNFCHM